MTFPEGSSSPNYEPTQYELQVLFDSLYCAIRDPSPRHRVEERHTDDDKHFTKIRLRSADILEVTQDPTVKDLSAQLKAVDEATTYSAFQIFVEMGVGDPYDDWQITKQLSLAKDPTFRPDPYPSHTYSLLKSSPALEDAVTPIPVRYAVDTGETEEIHAPVEEEIASMEDDMKKIHPDDLALLGRLAVVLIS